MLFDLLRMLDELISVKGSALLLFLFLFFNCGLLANISFIHRCFDLACYNFTVILLLKLLSILLIIAARQLRYFIQGS